MISKFSWNLRNLYEKVLFVVKLWSVLVRGLWSELLPDSFTCIIWYTRHWYLIPMERQWMVEQRFKFKLNKYALILLTCHGQKLSHISTKPIARAWAKHKGTLGLHDHLHAVSAIHWLPFPCIILLLEVVVNVSSLPAYLLLTFWLFVTSKNT